MPRAVSETPTSQSAAGFATKSMYQLISLCLVVIGCAGVAHADDAAQMPTVVRVYHVGNLVSADAIDSGSHFFGKATLQEWTSQHPATIKALDELCEIVDTMSENKPSTIKSYAPSLSLIVRHTEVGHKEIAQLLQQLCDNDPPSIHLEFRALVVKNELQVAPTDLTDDEAQRFSSLLGTKLRFTKAESAEFLSFIPAQPAQYKVALKSGRRTPWGDPNRPSTVTGRVDSETRTADIRIDFISDDHFEEPIKWASAVFSLADGESAIFQHDFDSAVVTWLVTAKLTTPQPAQKQIDGNEDQNRSGESDGN